MAMIPQTDPQAGFDPTDKPVVFSCSGCGDCCSSVSIPIDDTLMTHLKSKHWVQSRLKATQTEFIPYDLGRSLLPLADDGYCVFLGPAQNPESPHPVRHCLIHTHEGEAYKPLECRRYPFGAVQLPSGQTHYDCSGSCKTVTNTLLEQIVPIHPDDPASVPVNPEPFPENVPVRWGTAIPFSAYTAYQDQLGQLFRHHANHHPETLLRAVAAMLNALPKTNARVPKPFRFWPAWHRLIPYNALRQPYGILNRWAVLTEGSYSDPKIFGKGNICLKGHHRVAWDEATLNPLMNGYLHNVLQRRILLSYGHRLENMLLIAIHGYFLARWYAQTLALVQEKPTVTLDDLQLAIRLTERYYTGHQPSFLEFFRLWPFNGLYLRLLLG